MHVTYEKHMNMSPRRVSKISANFYLPRYLTEQDRTLLENSAMACPVHKSIHPDIVVETNFLYEL
jgi:putative redox protein